MPKPPPPKRNAPPYRSGGASPKGATPSPHIKGPRNTVPLAGKILMGACAVTLIGATIAIIVISTKDSEPTAAASAAQASTTTPAAPAQPQSMRLKRQVIASSDDLEQQPSGRIDATSEDIDLGDKPYCYVRFEDIAIPPGSEIQKAFIQFTAKAHSSESNPAYIIQAELTPNAKPPWLNQTRFISKRPTTTAQVSWENIPVWQNAGDAGEAQRTSDLSAIVQEIIDQSKWNSGNAIAFTIANSSAKRKVASYDLNPDWAPRLVVEYRVP